MINHAHVSYFHNIKDVLTVGDICIKNLDFGESVKEPGFTFAFGRFDGIFGLGKFFSPFFNEHLCPFSNN